MGPVSLCRCARAALSSLIGVGFLVAGLFQTRGGGARPSDLLWFILLFALCQFLAWRGYRRTREAVEAQSFDERLARRAARLAEQSAATGSVLGKLCARCEQRIVVAHDGCRCKTCSAPLHDGCERDHARLDHAPSPRTAYR